MYLLLSVLVLAPFWSLSTASPEMLLAEVQQMASAETNEGRFDVLSALLRKRNLPFIVEAFTIEEPVGREPRTEGRNVIVTLGEGDREIVVGAHYDAARLSDGSLSRGATDNAASSVMLVGLAEAIRAERLPLQVKVVWFDMEELGLIGSGRYVKIHGVERIAAMLNFDINAYGDTIVFGPSEPELNAGLRQTLAETCASERRNCVAFPQMPPGDDRSFLGAQVPTLSIAQLPAVEVHQLWLLMNAQKDSGLVQGHVPAILRTIHTADDTAAKVDGESMARLLEFAKTLVRKAAVR